MFMLCVIVSMLAVPAVAQDRWAASVRAQLRRQAEALGRLVGGNVTEAYVPFIQSLRQGYHQDISYRLTKGTTYVITGACDQDCRDIDFELWSGGEIIESDYDDDDHPVLVFTPPWTATYVVRAKMVHCSAPPCRYGVGVFK
jgi:hypothetical protein